MDEVDEHVTVTGESVIVRPVEELYIIRRIIARIMVPLTQLYGLYVIMHGEGGPGGGFQGGVILGSATILYVLVFGVDEAKKRISESLNNLMKSTGVLIYAGIGLLCIIFGGYYLEYYALPLGHPEKASELGILGVEIGIGITVSAVMISIFFDLAERFEK
jgi:multicomponent Na+:H+ antiporter subunit B